MSYLDVNVLRNFTRKLAAIIPPPKINQRNNGQLPKPQVSGEEIVLPTVSAGEETAPAKKPLVPNVIPSRSKPFSTDSVTAAGHPTIELPKSDQPAPNAIAETDEPAADPAEAPGMLGTAMQYATHPGTLWTVGGGLGAMGLAHLLSSKDDEDEGGGGILRNLLYGAGGAAAGYGAYKYGPQLVALLQQLMSKDKGVGSTANIPDTTNTLDTNVGDPLAPKPVAQSVSDAVGAGGVGQLPPTVEPAQINTNTTMGAPLR